MDDIADVDTVDGGIGLIAVRGLQVTEAVRDAAECRVGRELHEAVDGLEIRRLLARGQVAPFFTNGHRLGRAGTVVKGAGLGTRSGGRAGSAEQQRCCCEVHGAMNWDEMK